MSTATHSIHTEQPLPSLGRAILVIALAFGLAASVGQQAVAHVGVQVGTLAALPLGLLTFVVVGAAALVLVARTDARVSR